MGLCKCTDCGKLAFIRRDTQRSFVSPELEWRVNGEFPHPNGRQSYGSSVYCVALIKDYPTEIEDRKQVEQERTCKEFIQWQPGFTPKEHIEIDMIEERLKSDKAWRAEESRKAEEFHQRMLLLSQTQHADTMKASEAQHAAALKASETQHAATLNTSEKQHTSELLVIGMRATWILAIAAILAAIIGALVDRGYWLNPPEVKPIIIQLQATDVPNK